MSIAVVAVEALNKNGCTLDEIPRNYYKEKLLETSDSFNDNRFRDLFSEVFVSMKILHKICVIGYEDCLCTIRILHTYLIPQRSKNERYLLVASNVLDV